jgi:hypothetical protein
VTGDTGGGPAGCWAKLSDKGTRTAQKSAMPGDPAPFMTLRLHYWDVAGCGQDSNIFMPRNISNLQKRRSLKK